MFLTMPDNTVAVRTEISWGAGLDIAQRRDFAATIVLKRTREFATVTEIVQPASLRKKIVASKPRYSLELIHKWPLGVRYSELAEDVTALMKDHLPAGAPIVLDRTGIGLNVYEKLLENGLREVIGVHVGQGDIENKTAPGEWTVGKGRLITRCQASMADGRFLLHPNQPYAADLRRELHAMMVRYRPGSATPSLNGVGQHDDLVAALTLINWWIDREHDVVATGRRIRTQPLLV